MIENLKKLALVTNLCIAIVAASAGFASAAPVDLPDGSKLDITAICPVCEMKLETGTLGPAAVVFKDGKVVGLDGPGDLLRFVLSPEKYKFNPADIKNMYVTEQGSKKFIDARTAFFVLGANITGAMGPEAIPFSNKEDARKYKEEHKAKSVAPFATIALEDLASKKPKLKMEHGESKH
jgi:copper chaperone NosL